MLVWAACFAFALLFLSFETTVWFKADDDWDGCRPAQRLSAVVDDVLRAIPPLDDGFDWNKLCSFELLRLGADPTLHITNDILRANFRKPVK